MIGGKSEGGKHTKLITDNDNDGYFDCTSNPKCENNTCNDCIFYKSKYKEMIELGLIFGNKEMLKLSNCKKPKVNTDRPNCDCGYPSEINMYNDELYYNCPLKNAQWIEFDNLGLHKNCKFYQKYHKDKNEICLLSRNYGLKKNES